MNPSLMMRLGALACLSGLLAIAFTDAGVVSRLLPDDEPMNEAVTDRLLFLRVTFGATGIAVLGFFLY